VRKGLILENPSKIPPELAYNIDEAKYDLSTAYQRIGSLDVALGNPWDAGDAYRSCRDIAKKLVQRNPSVKYLQLLSRAYYGLGAAGRKQEPLALPTCGAATVGLMSSPMGQGLFLPAFALIPQKIKKMKFEEAEDYYKQAQKAIQEAAAREPENGDLQHDLALSYSALGDTDIELGKIPEAMEAYRLYWREIWLIQQRGLAGATLAEPQP
jgi:tetratricopeptide (TPR) repeat protein